MLSSALRARLRGAAPRPAGSAEILEHLARLLGSRHGACAFDRELGIPDLVDLSNRFPEGIGSLQRLLADTIQKQEPRLRNVRVLALEEDRNRPLVLRFAVRAELAAGGSLGFQTNIHQGGRVSIT